MDARRGMLRLWVVSSVVFIVIVASTSINDISNGFHATNVDVDAIAQRYGGKKLYPILCVYARGIQGKDYKVSSTEQGICYYYIEDLRRLYPEYNNLGSTELNNKLYTNIGQTQPYPANPWRRIWKAVGIATGIPLAVFILGYSVIWVMAGFRQSQLRSGRN